MKIIIIAAHDPNLVIGNEGSLPWHYSEDLKHFKTTTSGHPIVMGRGVFEELGEKPLPNRQNIVLTTTRNYDNVACYSSLEQALEAIEREGSPVVYIIGGGVVYEQCMNKADELIITLIHKEYKGDTFFPEYRDQIGVRWEETARTEYDELSFITYTRIETH
jgi:dihydrofolate reductase